MIKSMSKAGVKGPKTALSARQTALFEAVRDEFELNAPAAAMLESACRLLDVADAAAKLVKRDGIILDATRGTNPAVAVERNSRREASAIFARLGVTVKPEEE